LIILIILGGEYNLWSSSLCSFLFSLPLESGTMFIPIRARKYYLKSNRKTLTDATLTSTAKTCARSSTKWKEETSACLYWRKKFSERYPSPTFRDRTKGIFYSELLSICVREVLCFPQSLQATCWMVPEWHENTLPQSYTIQQSPIILRFDDRPI
jgi:hypothetical protein